MTEEEKMAAEWEAAAGGEGDGNGAKALSQNEIDSLLGFEGDKNGDGQSGIQAIINSALGRRSRWSSTCPNCW